MYQNTVTLLYYLILQWLLEILIANCIKLRLNGEVTFVMLCLQCS